MEIDVLTVFPGMFTGPLDESMLKRAKQKNLVDIKVHNLRDWAEDKHQQVDDRPYGGGEGMLLKIDPIYRAVEDLKKRSKSKNSHVVLTSPAGRPFNWRIARKLANLPHLIFLCGHYEGVDHRVFENIADEQISIGDYILTGGELPAMVIIDTVSRLIPGVVGNEESIDNESFNYLKNLLKHPQYTRPEEFEGLRVPEELLSGDHKKIKEWQKEQAIELTKKMRPDLLEKVRWPKK